MASTPSRRDRSRPAELVLLALVVGVFTGLVVLISARSVISALIFLGVAFILTLVVLAMLSLAVKPGPDERLDLEDQDRAGH